MQVRPLSGAPHSNTKSPCFERGFCIMLKASVCAALRLALSSLAGRVFTSRTVVRDFASRNRKNARRCSTVIMWICFKPICSTQWRCFCSDCPKGNTVSLRETRKNNAGLLISSCVDFSVFARPSFRQITAFFRRMVVSLPKRHCRKDCIKALCK